jgi:hypothetical protein
VQWFGWHLAEVAGVTAPTVLALTVWPWFALLTVVVAVGWVAHEVGLHRRRRALVAARTRQAVTSPPAARDDQASA